MQNLTVYLSRLLCSVYTVAFTGGKEKTFFNPFFACCTVPLVAPRGEIEPAFVAVKLKPCSCCVFHDLRVGRPEPKV